MNITNDPGVLAATMAAQSSSADNVQMLVLKKALDAQTANAQSMLQSIPQPPALATEGSVGTRINTYA